jgi:hypothetical protein
MNAPDFLTLSGAETLMRRIWLFWKKQGHSVALWIELDCGAYCVRSDLVDGMPRGARTA